MSILTNSPHYVICCVMFIVSCFCLFSSHSVILSMRLCAVTKCQSSVASVSITLNFKNHIIVLPVNEKDQNMLSESTYDTIMI